MESQKILLIDSISTIIRGNYFIKDEVPRILASYIEDGFKIWLLENYNDFENLEIPCIPFWLKENVVIIDKEILKGIKNYKYSKDSFILTNDINHSKDLKMNFKIVTSFELFKTDKYEQMNIADVIICFGFNIMEFMKFCKDSNLLGISDFESKINGNVKNPDGVAFLVNNDGNDFENKFNKIIDEFNDLVKSKKYKIKHNEYIIGITYKGEGIENVNLNILDGNKLPLLLV